MKIRWWKRRSSPAKQALQPVKEQLPNAPSSPALMYSSTSSDVSSEGNSNEVLSPEEKQHVFMSRLKVLSQRHVKEIVPNQQKQHKRNHSFGPERIFRQRSTKSQQVPTAPPEPTNPLRLLMKPSVEMTRHFQSFYSIVTALTEGMDAMCAETIPNETPTTEPYGKRQHEGPLLLRQMMMQDVPIPTCIDVVSRRTLSPKPLVMDYAVVDRGNSILNHVQIVASGTFDDDTFGGANDAISVTSSIPTTASMCWEQY
jgi:hypothetical protein